MGQIENTTAAVRLRKIIPTEQDNNHGYLVLSASQFIEQSSIPSWGERYEATPQKLVSYNNDLTGESYEKSRHHVSGAQRKVMSERIIDAHDRRDHMFKARSAEFFPPNDIKLPKDSEQALQLHATTPAGQIRSFRARQPAKLASLSQMAAPAQAARGALIPPDTSYHAGRIRPAVLEPLLSAQGMGGSRWLRQFVFGFPIIGQLDQEGVFPQSTKELPTPITTESLFNGAASRFADRTSRSVSRDFANLQKESTVQAKSGRLDNPELATDHGRIARAPADAIDLALRFCVHQLHKLRACGDLKRAGANAACSILTPNSLPAWDHITRLASRVATTQPNWPFVKEDHSPAYKWFPYSPTMRGSQLLHSDRQSTTSGIASHHELSFLAQQLRFCTTRVSSAL